MNSLYEKAERLLIEVAKTEEHSSATISIFKGNSKLFRKVLKTLNEKLPSKREKMIDLGCGHGGLAKLFGYSLGFKEIHGIDRESQRLSDSKERGLQIYELNLEENSFPFPNNSFDLVTSFGVLEHLTYYDNIIKETHRILKNTGIFLLSAPNLGSWVDRVALLLGHQPRNLEISRFKIVGVHNLYHSQFKKLRPVGHISTCTLRAIEELLKHYGFRIEDCWGTGIVPQPGYKQKLFLKIIDTLLSKRTSLAVRFILVAKKQSALK